MTVWIDGRAATEEQRALVADRGWLYGDGLFETMRVVDGVVALLDRHVRRACLGLSRLGAKDHPSASELAEEIKHIAKEMGEGVIRMSLSRVGEGRGYCPPNRSRWRRILSTFSLPMTPSSVRLCISSVRMGQSNALGAMKHSGRGEQVLAAADASNRHYDDALMLNGLGQIIEATAANVFIEVNGRWLTPVINNAGVRGVYRDWLIDRAKASGQPIAVRPIHVGMLERATAVVLCNAVRGAWCASSITPFGPMSCDRGQEYLSRMGAPW